MDKKKHNGLFILLLWFIAIIYVLAIDLKGIWTDEGYRFILLSGGKTWQQFNQTGSFGSFSDVLNVVAPSPYQPLFYLVDNAVVRITRSHSDVLLRLVNILWLMLSLQGLLRLFQKYDIRTRLFAVVIFGLNGFLLMNVMQIREYTSYLALMIWSSCILFEILETQEAKSLQRLWPKLLAYGILMALLFYSHPYSVFALAAQVVMVLLERKDRWRRVRLMTASYGIAAVLASPWIYLVLRHSTQKMDPGLWDRRLATLSLLLSSLGIGFRGVLTYGTWSGQPLMQVFVATIVLGIPAAWISSRILREKAESRSIYGLLTVVFFGIFQAAYFFLREPLSVWPRYFIGYYYGYAVAATCAYAVLSRAGARKPRGWPAAAAIGVLLLVFICGLAEYRMYREDPFMDTGMTATCNWRVLSRGMLSYVRPEDTIIYSQPLVGWTMGITYPYYPNELSYGDIGSGRFPKRPVLWVFDNQAPALAGQTLARLFSSKYALNRTVDLGCQCKLFRLELSENATSNMADPPPPNAVVIDAPAMASGTARLDNNVWGRGMPVIETAQSPTWTEFTLDVPAAGTYDLRVRCASEESRPVTVRLNGRKLTDGLCGLPTGGYLPTSQQWQAAGVYEFLKGKARMRLESQGPFPHISTLALVPQAPKK